jgi:hypothetical protein
MSQGDVTDDIGCELPRLYSYSCRQIHSVREAEMNELKKKCWREKVTAEITVTHVQEFAHELGAKLDAAEVAQFLNQNGLAQNVWIHMMEAGEQYIKSSLQSKVRVVAVPQSCRTGAQAVMVQ